MKGKILMGSIIALAIAFSSLAGDNNLFGVNAVSADTYPINSIPCATVTYSAWGDCINGIKTRDVIDKTPINCSLTLNEQQGRSEVCGQVLGLKIYAVGTLLRAPEGKIYVVMPGQAIKLIPDLAALQAYRGREIHNVSDALIKQYRQNFGQVLGVKIYADGTLLRGPDHKIYVIVNGKKQYIHSLQELYQYRDRRIINVSAAVIADF
ncbi:MAG: hypothetical protein PHE24_06125 [Patescibacteria group bacterium]|nr:hypothetical protein [Patescibacteria group bacterium]